MAKVGGIEDVLGLELMRSMHIIDLLNHLLCLYMYVFARPSQTVRLNLYINPVICYRRRDWSFTSESPSELMSCRVFNLRQKIIIQTLGQF